LTDRSHRPHHHPGQLAGEIEARVCELRRTHPRWGPRRLVHELRRLGVDPLPSRSTVYRVLVRHSLVSAISRKRRREDYRRWERSGPMQLWQLDVMGSVFIKDPSTPGGVMEAKLISGIDDHSRYSVIGKVVSRATARAVCTAFVSALAEYGVPERGSAQRHSNSMSACGCSLGAAGWVRICGFRRPLITTAKRTGLGASCPLIVG
jgi:hypothetical protein